MRIYYDKTEPWSAEGEDGWDYGTVPGQPQPITLGFRH